MSARILDRRSARWAIPILTALLLATAAIAAGEGFGLKVQDAAGGTGAQVAEVAVGGPAAQAGLKAGDLIVEIDGQAIRSGLELAQRLLSVRPGQPVTLIVERGGWRKQVSLGRHAPPEPLSPSPPSPRIGVRVADQPPTGSPGYGAVITGVDADSPAARAGLAAGDVILAAGGKEIRNTAEFAALARTQGGKAELDLRISREGWKRTTRLELGQAQVQVSADDPCEKGWLGVQIRDVENRPGAMVVQLNDGSRAVGILQPDDRITGLDGMAVVDVRALVTAIGATLPGQLIELEVERKGTFQTIRIRLASMPESICMQLRGQGRLDALQTEEAVSTVGQQAPQYGTQYEAPRSPAQGGDPAAPRADRRCATVSVGDFQVKAAKASQQIGDGLREMFHTSLHNSGYFIVLERMDIKGLAAEQALSRSNMAGAGAAVPKAQMDVADVIVYGVVSEFEPEAGGMAFGNFIPQARMSVKQSSRFSEMAIDVRAVDVRTGRVLVAHRIPGSAQSYSAGVGMSIGSGRLNMPVGLEAYRNTPMEFAIRDCIQKASYYVINNIPQEYFRHE